MKRFIKIALGVVVVTGVVVVGAVQSWLNEGKEFSKVYAGNHYYDMEFLWHRLPHHAIISDDDLSYSAISKIEIDHKKLLWAGDMPGISYQYGQVINNYGTKIGHITRLCESLLKESNHPTSVIIPLGGKYDPPLGARVLFCTSKACRNKLFKHQPGIYHRDTWLYKHEGPNSSGVDYTYTGYVAFDINQIGTITDEQISMACAPSTERMFHDDFYFDKMKPDELERD